jgi:hypothetical protein
MAIHKALEKSYQGGIYMTNITINGETDLKRCPFRTDKKGQSRCCSGACALYIGRFPFGDCAFYVNAVSPISKSEKPKEET